MLFADTGVISGHTTGADILFLIAAILFGIEALLVVANRDIERHGGLIPAGLCLVAVAWLIL
jgi:hypothetical protein